MPALVVLELHAIRVRLVVPEMVERVLGVGERRSHVVVAGAGHHVQIRVLGHRRAQRLRRARIPAAEIARREDARVVPPAGVAASVVLKIGLVIEIVVEEAHVRRHERPRRRDVRRIVVLALARRVAVETDHAAVVAANRLALVAQQLGPEHAGIDAESSC